MIALPISCIESLGTFIFATRVADFFFVSLLFFFVFLNYLLPFSLQELLLIFCGLIFGTGYSNNGGAEGDDALPMQGLQQ